jgi:HK97 family phage major capsid protein/HK97 family phage prohead protease
MPRSPANFITGNHLVRGLDPNKPLTREFQIRSIDEDKRTIDVAFSSESEVDRGYFIEILDHSPGACDLSRLQIAGNALFNHDRNTVVGVIEDARIDTDRKGRARIRFSKNKRATEIFSDITDGILKSISVGYHIRDWKQTEEREGIPVYTATRWTPFEISIVTIPADLAAGVGRTQPLNPAIMDDNAETDTAPNNQPHEQRPPAGNGSRSQPENPPAQPPARNPMNVEEIRSQASQNERERFRAIMDFANRRNLSELGTRAINEGMSFDEFRTQALDELERRTQALDEQSRPIGLNEREVANFSLVRLIGAIAEPHNRSLQEAARFEMEACEAAAEQMQRSVKGAMIPVDVLSHRCMTPRGMQVRGDILSVSGVGAGYTDTGENLVPTSMRAESFIDVLRKKSVLLDYASVMSDLMGNIDIPRQTTQASASWIGEDDDAPQEEADFDALSLNPKTISARMIATRKMVKHGGIGIENFMRRELASAIARGLDYGGFYADGTNDAPTGIKSSSPNTVDFTAVLPTFAEIVDMETQVAADDADVENMIYIFGAAMRGHLKTTPKVSGQDSFIWEPGNTVNGYAARVTNQVVTGDVFFGNFADILVGQWGGIEILVDPYTRAAKQGLQIVAMMDADFGIRHPESFCYGDQLTP